MSRPGIVEDELGEEAVAAQVSLGDDEAFVTEERTLVYRAGGVLSDESVSAFPHGAERLTVSEGRRKASVGFEYAVEDDREMAVPKDSLEELLQPVLASVLRASGVTDADERFLHAFRFPELTLVVTGERLIKHVGSVLWDADYESYRYEDVTDVDYEEGTTATSVVLTVDGRKERIKASNDRLGEVREFLESALFDYHGVASAEELGERDEPETDEGHDQNTTEDLASFGDGIDPLIEDDERSERKPGDETPGGEEDEPADADGEETGADATGTDDSDGDQSDAESDEPDTPFTETFEPAADDLHSRVEDELSELRVAVQKQNELLVEQHRAIETLLEELREE